MASLPKSTVVLVLSIAIVLIDNLRAETKYHDQDGKKCRLLTESSVNVEVTVNGQDTHVTLQETRGYKCIQSAPSSVVACSSKQRLQQTGYDASPQSGQQSLPEKYTYAICHPVNVTRVSRDVTVEVGGSTSTVTVEWANITSCKCMRSQTEF